MIHVTSVAQRVTGTLAGAQGLFPGHRVIEQRWRGHDCEGVRQW
jgi:hypothetical protein